MCGIAGFFNASLNLPRDAQTIIDEMSATLARRGPDDSGRWLDREAGVVLGHRRLSVIDTSDAGHQPMVSLSGKTVIAYNGEVYNAGDLRQRLIGDGAKFQGHSDTEVILEACDRWGVLHTVDQLIGMFAFAIWDRRKRELTLARDRMGIKPLYWGYVGETVVFGSELKPFFAFPGFEKRLDASAVSAFLRYAYVPTPSSIFQGIHKLEPGHLLRFTATGESESSAFWQLEDVVEEGRRAPFRGSDADATDELETLLSDAVSRRMIADVPLGAFLSGGIDSSLVVSLMQARSSRPVKTFTIGLDAAGYDESAAAKAIAHHLSTDHTELRLESSQVMDTISEIPQWYDEPFADSSQIPTYLVSKLARESVTVALSGDGGDELFAGYERYRWAPRIWQAIGWAPVSLRRAAASCIDRVPASFLAAAARLGDFAQGDIKARKLSRILALDSADDQFRHLVSSWPDPGAITHGSPEALSRYDDPFISESIPDFRERMQFMDMAGYLPDDILTKVDRASMAVSLECRVPILDHRVVEFSWRLPSRLKFRDGKGKWILRQILAPHVPDSLFERPKMGFGIPVGDWLRGPLLDWSEDLLSEQSLADSGLLDPMPIRAVWSGHKSGKSDATERIWAVLMFQAWRRHWML